MMHVPFSIDCAGSPGSELIAACVPFVPQLRQSLAEELGQRDHLLERSAAFGWGVGQQRQPLPEQCRVLAVEGGIEVLRLLTRRVQAHPVHPFTGHAGAPRIR